MMEIGEYVRTKKQGIKRIDTIFEGRPVNRYGYEIGSEWDGKLYSIIKTTEIIKHSYNPRELIEPCDILRYRVNQFHEDIQEVKVYKDARSGKEYLGVEGFGLHQIEILEILTKEQFNANCYSLEG